VSVSFTPSTRYQQWITKLRVSWMGIKAQAIMGAFAKVAGDLTYDWALRAQLEHLPEYASPTGVAYVASERQLDTNPAIESTAALATRTTQAAILWKYAGTPLGMLLALHYIGFDNAVIVTQNGLAYQLQLPLPPIPVISGQAWQPQTSLVVTQCSQLAVALTSNVTPPTSSTLGRSIPAGNAWWDFDSNTDLCSRFAILFPGPLNVPFLFSVNGRATFVSSDSAALSWNSPLAAPASTSSSGGAPSSSYFVVVGPPVVTDGSGPVNVTADQTTQTLTGVTLRASAPFIGYVDCTVIGLAATDAQRLQSVIGKWRPKKATCVGVYVCLQGKFFGWPVQQEAANTVGPFSIAMYAGA